MMALRIRFLRYFRLRWWLLASVLLPFSVMASGLDLSAHRGKVVYLDFWASWCGPCRDSFPWMNKMQAKYADKLVIVSVNLDKDRKLAEAFLKDHPAQFQIIYDPKGKYASYYQIEGMPSSILFDHTGKPVSGHKGFFVKKMEQYEQEIQHQIQQIPTLE